MIAQVLANVHLFNLAVLIFNLEEDFFIKLVVVPLEHRLGDLLSAVVVQDRTAVQILEQHRLGKGRLVVEARTAVSIMTRADFEVK